jgi:hypothetical protein
MPLPKISTSDPAKMAAINYARTHTRPMVDVLIGFSEGEWTYARFVDTTVDDWRFLAAWLTAAGHFGRRNYVEFNALVTWIVAHMDELLGVPWHNPGKVPGPKPG